MTQLVWLKKSHFNQSIIYGIIAGTVLFLAPVQNAASQQSSTSVTQSELIEGQLVVPCPLLVQLNIKGMTDEEVVAINKAWEIQPERIHGYIIQFFMENIRHFKGLEKEWVISLTNRLHRELTKEEILSEELLDISVEEYIQWQKPYEKQIIDDINILSRAGFFASWFNTAPNYVQ